MRVRTVLSSLITVALLQAACGGDGPSEPDTTLPHGSMSARLDGNSWRASAALQVTWNDAILAFAGVDGSALSIGMAVIAAGPGTYALAQGTPNNALITAGSQTWHAAGVNGTGTLTLTTLTAAGATGTFSFTAPAVAGSTASGTRTVTEGTFNLTF